MLFWALVLVVVGSLVGEFLGMTGRLGQLWFWLGHQGSEYLDLGRFWQLLLVVGLVLWLFLMFRALRPAIRREGTSDVSALFLYAAGAIPVFYLPAVFYGPHTNFAVIDNWRFWIIHLWVEGFFELFATVLVAIMFRQIGLVSTRTATRLVYLDAMLFLAGGIIGTGHHWYFTGQGTLNMGLAACFSALEVVPLTLLTLDASGFIRLEAPRDRRRSGPGLQGTSGPSTSSSRSASGTSLALASSASSSTRRSSRTSRWAPSSPSLRSSRWPEPASDEGTTRRR